MPTRRKLKPPEILHRAETTLEIIERIVGRLIILGFASVEGYKYIRWLLEH